MKNRDIRWFLVLLANGLFIWLNALANHHLAPFAVHLYLGGALVTYSALRLDFRHGLIAVALTGLAFDALEPVPFGTHIVFLGIIHATLHSGRRQFPRDEPIFATVVALIANLFLFLALSFLLVGANPRPGEAWLRLFVDLLASQIVIAVVMPWFMSLNGHLLARANLNPETGRRVEL